MACKLTHGFASFKFDPIASFTHRAARTFGSLREQKRYVPLGSKVSPAPTVWGRESEILVQAPTGILTLGWPLARASSSPPPHAPQHGDIHFLGEGRALQVAEDCLGVRALLVPKKQHSLWSRALQVEEKVAEGVVLVVVAFSSSPFAHTTGGTSEKTNATFRGRE